jgi:hypothetical protein
MFFSFNSLMVIHEDPRPQNEMFLGKTGGED